MTGEIHEEIWSLEDEYIERRIAGEVINIDEYCSKPNLSAEMKKELRERLAEYEASQKGLEKFVKEHIDADAVWKRISARISEMKKIAEVVYTAFIATYILRRPYVRQGWRGATGNRLIHESDDFRWEILQDRTSLILSLVAKSKKPIGKYVTINVKSASKVKRHSEIIQWKQEGPTNIGSEDTIDIGGRVEIVVAETKLDMGTEEDFDLLKQIFEEIELKVFGEKAKIRGR